MTHIIFQIQNYLVKKQAVLDSIGEVRAFFKISMDELRSSGNAHEVEIQHCVNNCKFLTADFCWNIQGLR